MLGDSLLVGSFLSRAEREESGEKVNLYLPKGDWYDWFSGKKYRGSQWIYYQVPADRGGALFVKAGSAIPMIRSGKNIGMKPFEEYLVKVWPDEGGNASGMLYEDDGLTFGYQKGEYRVTSLKVSGSQLFAESCGAYPGMPEITFELTGEA